MRDWTQTFAIKKEMHQKLAIPILLLGLYLCSCKDAKDAGIEVSQKLNATGDIAVEIEQAYKIECNPYLRLEDDVARIELNVEDPEFDHQSLATEVTKLKSVQSFEGALHLVFFHRGAQPDSDAPTMWIKYNARTGKQLEP